MIPQIVIIYNIPTKSGAILETFQGATKSGNERTPTYHPDYNPAISADMAIFTQNHEIKGIQ
jgi:hypothetical protein